MKWIWQSSKYPKFSYNEADFASLLNDIERNNQKIENLINNSKIDNLSLNSQINSLENEIINSASIEGEILQRESVRSSLRKRLDKQFDFLSDKYATRHTDNYASLLLDTNLNKNPLTLERLHGWHNCLFEYGYQGLHKINIAKFRNEEIDVVSGAIGREKVHYEAIPYKNIDKEMDRFLDFCNNSNIDSYIKSAIAHLWFVIIHPYDDGNGRIARAIADFLLPNKNIKLYSLSKEINSYKKEYYDCLERTTKNNEQCDISKWIEWHLNINNLALKSAIAEINKVLVKTKFWDTFRDCNLNENQQLFLNKILDIGIDDFKGKINLTRYLALTKASTNTEKDFFELVRMGCLIENKKENNSFVLNVDTHQLKLESENIQKSISKPKIRRNR